MINVARYKHLSKIKEKWGPSLDELTAHGYLAGWEVQRTVADDDFKIVFIHGPRFLKAEALPSDSQEAEPLTYGSNDELHDLGALEEDLTEGDLVAELTARGVTRRVAKTLLRDLPEPVQAERFLEWADREIERVAPENTAGFLVYLIREHVAPPPDFLSRRQLREVERQDASARRVDAERVRRVERYESYVEGEVDKYLASLTPEDYEARVREKAVQLKARFNVLRTAPTETVQESARRAFRAEVAKELALLPFDAFESGPVDA